MAIASPEQAQQLLDNGTISKNTFDSLMADSTAAPAVAEPVQDTLEDVPQMTPEQELAQTQAGLGRGMLAPDEQGKVTVPIPEIPGRGLVKVSGDQAPAPEAERQPGSDTSATALPKNVPMITDTTKTAQTPDGKEKALTSYKAESDAAYGQVAKGLEEQARIGIEQGVKTAAQITSAQNAMKVAAEKSAVTSALEQEQIEEQRKEVEQTISWAKEKAVIDPNRFWNSRNTEQKIGIGIGMFLGAFGGSQGNGAVDVIKDAISRDIEAQKATATNAKGIASEQQSLYGQILAKVKDKNLAEHMTRAAMMDQTRLMIESQATKYKGQEVAAQARIGLGQLGLQRAELQNKIDQQIATRQMLGSSGGGAGDDIKKIVYGAEAIGLTPKDVMEEYKEYQGHQAAIKNIKEAYKTIADNRFSVLPGDVSVKDAAKTAILSKAKEIFGGLSEQEIEMLEHNVPNRADTSDKSVNTKLKIILDMLETKNQYPSLDALKITKPRLPFKEGGLVK